MCMLRNLIKIVFVCMCLSLSFNLFANTQKEKSVNTFFQEFILAYEKKDIKSLGEFFAPNAVVIGTNQDEVLRGKKAILNQFKKELQQISHAEVKLHPVAIEVNNEYAFVTYLMTVRVTPCVIPAQAGIYSENGAALISRWIPAYAGMTMRDAANIHHNMITEKLRFSAGLIKENNQWLIAQSHLSAPESV